MSWLMLLTPQPTLRFAMCGKRDFRGWGNCFPPGWCSLEGIAFAQEWWWLWYPRMAQYRNPGGCVPTSLSRVTNPRLSLGNPVYTDPQLLEPKASVYELFVWPFNRVPGSPMNFTSPWQTESLPLFTARCYLGTSSWIWCSGLGSLA